VTTGLVSAIDAGLELLKIHLPVPRLDLAPAACRRSTPVHLDLSSRRRNRTGSVPQD
jgi:hypothetical protein